MNVHPISHSIAYVDCTKSGGSKKQKNKKTKKQANGSKLIWVVSTIERFKSFFLQKASHNDNESEPHTLFLSNHPNFYFMKTWLCQLAPNVTPILSPSPSWSWIGPPPLPNNYLSPISVCNIFNFITHLSSLNPFLYFQIWFFDLSSKLPASISLVLSRNFGIKMCHCHINCNNHELWVTWLH